MVNRHTNLERRSEVVATPARDRDGGVARPMGGHHKRLLEPHRALVIGRVKAVPDITLKALVAELVEQFLLPTLNPGDIVIMDNPGSHKGQAVRKAIRSASAKLLFLPPYSPDLNSIEQAFAKLKLLLRKAAERSIDATWRRIGTLLHTFPPHKCPSYLRNSGHAST